MPGVVTIQVLADRVRLWASASASGLLLFESTRVVNGAASARDAAAVADFVAQAALTSVEDDTTNLTLRVFTASGLLLRGGQFESVEAMSRMQTGLNAHLAGVIAYVGT